MYGIESMYAPSLDRTDSANHVHPPLLDLSKPDAELRGTVRAALMNTLTPMVGLVNHGCESACAALAEAMRGQIAAAGGLGEVKEQACQVEGACATAAAELRSCLRDVCLRALSIALDDESIDKTLATRGLDLEGRLCLRVYPSLAESSRIVDANVPLRLGAHCDSTLLTLLWSDSPGLQVLDPQRASEWTSAAILRYGLPTTGDVDAVIALREDQWATVILPWHANPLLLTLGTSWLSHELTATACPARCAVLHRVSLPTERARHSLPFLADLVAVEHAVEAVSPVTPRPGVVEE